MLVDLHHRRLVAAAVAVVGRGEDGEENVVVRSFDLETLATGSSCSVGPNRAEPRGPEQSAARAFDLIFLATRELSS